MSDPRATPISDYMDNSTPADVQQSAEPIISTTRLVHTLLSRAKKKRSVFDWRWNEYYDFFKGKQWPVERPRWRFSESVNVCWSTVWSTTSIMTDSRPEIAYAPVEPSDLAWTEMLSKVEDMNWEKYSCLFTLTDGLVDSQVYDAGHYISEWDPTLENGLGDISLKVLDPYFCFPDPLATDICDARYFIYNKPIPLSVLKAKHPKIADKLYADVVDVGQGQDRTQTNMPNFVTGVEFGAYPANSSLQTTNHVNSGGEPLVMLIRCWLKDDTLEQLQQEVEPKPGEKKTLYVMKKKFPKGRYIEIACNQVLYDGHNGCMMPSGECIPYEHGRFPITKVVDHSYPREYWGSGEIEQLKGPQKIRNYLWSFALDHLKQSGNPQWKVGARAGVDSDNITNEPGLIIECADPSQVMREPGESLPGGLLPMIEMAGQMEDIVTGLKDVSRGTIQPGVTSGLMLEGYVEAAQTRIRLKNRNLDKSLQEIGQLRLELMMQFYTAPRMTRIVNAEGAPEYVEFFVQNDGDRKAFIFRRSMNHPEQGVILGPSQQVDIKGMPDVRVTTGSSLPFAKGQKQQLAKESLQLGAIDQEEYLNAIDWPNKDKVIQRMAEKAEQMAQMEAQQGAK